MQFERDTLGLMTREVEWCYDNRNRLEAARVLEAREMWLKSRDEGERLQALHDATRALRAIRGRPPARSEQFYAYVVRNPQGIEALVHVGMQVRVMDRDLIVLKPLIGNDLENMIGIKRQARELATSESMPMSLRLYRQGRSLEDADLDRIQNPDSHRQGIMSSFWVWIARINDHGDEEMMSVSNPAGVAEPLLACDIVRARELRSLAAKVRKKGQTLSLRQYDFADLVDEAIIP